VALGARPPGLRRFLLLAAAFFAAFLLTGPWRIAGREIGRTPAVLAVVAVLGSMAFAVRPGWRAWAREFLSTEDVALSRRGLVIFCLAVAAALARILLARFAALEVNAWDFSLYFDRPVESVLHGRLLYSDLLKGSTLGDDASFAMFAFVPLYAIFPSPLWLVLAPAVAIAGAAGAAFLLLRATFEDDVAALLLSAAFVLHSATARAVQYVFHVEIFYPLAIFLSLWALCRKRPVAFAAGLVLLVSLKEDALLPATALALFALLMRADRRWIAASWLAAAAVFAADYFVVLPRFSASGAGRPWFSWYWARYGSSPLAAAAGIAGHPLRAAADVARSGLGNLLEPLLLTPLAGLEWLAAALPALVPYAVAQHGKLSRFTLYYSMPVLPFLFIAAGWGLARIARRFRKNRIAAFRIGAALVLAACALDGAGYTLARPRPERSRIRPLLSELSPDTQAYVQGALLPHAGYAARFSVLDRDGAVPDGAHAYLLDPDADPYPFAGNDLRALARTLDADSRYSRRPATGALVLYAPSPAPAR
jgi:uncharacterized membrane protein